MQKQKQNLALKSFYNYDSLKNLEDLSDDIIQANLEMTDMEIESLTSILNEMELQIKTTEVLDQDDDELINKISKVFKLSLIPNSNRKFLIYDNAKDTSIELRCLPAIELYFAIPHAYPSNIGPLFYMDTSFYEPFKNFLYDQLAQKWYENNPVTYECIINIQDDFLNSFFDQGDLGNVKLNDRGQVQFNYIGVDFQRVFEKSMEAQRRSFNNEEHDCKICMRKYLGDKFFFLSGCEHFFCYDCMITMVNQAINQNQVNKLICGEASCKKNLNDIDIRNLGLDRQTIEKYDKISLTNAIAQMDDLGWCPLPGCDSLATIEKDVNYGKCQHCDFMFCLDCRERYHPYKRCMVNRLDLVDIISEAEKESLDMKNKRAEEALNILFFRYCAKFCPNLKCGIRIQKEKSGCTKMQCPKCHHHFCWACLHDAKGMKHYKEKPECNDDGPHLQPEHLTQDIKNKHLAEGDDYINLKFCVLCPHCKSINQKKTKQNMLECVRCAGVFCYICNKPISGPEHYQGKSLCHVESDPWTDF